MSNLIEIPLRDQSLTLYEARPAAGQGPGVIILHAWWGLNDFFKEVCDRLAAEGFLTVAPDLYNGELADTPEEAEKLMDRASSAFFNESVEAALDYLLLHPGVQGQRVGVVGFSMGAPLAFRLSTLKPEQVAAVVTFYGTGQADFSRSRAVYQGHFAEEDDFEPSEDVQQLEQSLLQAGRQVTFHTYPQAGHWFLEANRPNNFHEESAVLAWERLIKFLHQHLD